MASDSDEISQAKSRIEARRQSARVQASVQRSRDVVALLLRSLADPSGFSVDAWTDEHAAEYAATFLVRLDPVPRNASPSVASVMAETQEKFDDEQWAAFQGRRLKDAPSRRFGEESMRWAELRSAQLTLSLWTTLAARIHEAGLVKKWASVLRSPAIAQELSRLETVHGFDSKVAAAIGGDLLEELLRAPSVGVLAQLEQTLLRLRRELPVTFRMLGRYACALASHVQQISEDAAAEAKLRASTVPPDQSASIEGNEQAGVPTVGGDVAAAVRRYRDSRDLPTDPGRTPTNWFVDNKKGLAVAAHCRQLLDLHLLGIVRSLIASGELATWVEADPETVVRASPRLTELRESVALGQHPMSPEGMVAVAQRTIADVASSLRLGSPAEDHVVEVLAALDVRVRTSLPDVFLALLMYAGGRVPDRAGTGANSLVRDPSGVWRADFRGVGATFRNLLGISYLQKLLLQPHTPAEASQLAMAQRSESSRVSEDQVEPDFIDGGLDRDEEVIDAEGLQSLREAITRLRKERTEAIALDDRSALKEVEDKIAAILVEIRRAVNVHGKSRRFPGRGSKHSAAVGKALERAIQHIEEQHPTLGAHLRASVRDIHTGAPVYAPKDGVSWMR